MTLLQEIQKEAAASGVDLSAVLKKCKILAARLGSKEFAQWVAWELDGYPEDQPVPEYRKLSVQYYANFMGVGWEARKQPFLWPALGKEVSKRSIQSSFAVESRKLLRSLKAQQSIGLSWPYSSKGRCFPK